MGTDSLYTKFLSAPPQKIDKIRKGKYFSIACKYAGDTVVV